MTAGSGRTVPGGDSGALTSFQLEVAQLSPILAEAHARVINMRCLEHDPDATFAYGTHRLRRRQQQLTY